MPDTPPWEQQTDVPPWERQFKLKAFSARPERSVEQAYSEFVREEARKEPWLKRQVLGMGTAGSNLAEGARELLGAKPDVSNVLANRAVSKAAPVGSAVGELAALTPPFMLPGGSSLLGSTLVGGAEGALEPTLTGESRARNVAGGALGGALGKATGDLLASRASAKIAGLPIKQEQNALRDEVWRKAQAAGYKIPGSMVHEGALWSRILEGAPGKLKMHAEASTANQEVTNAVVRNDLDLPPQAGLSLETLNHLRDQWYEKYRALLDANYGHVVETNPPAFSSEWATLPTHGSRPAGVVGSDEYFAKVKDIFSQYTELHRKFPNIARTKGAEGHMKDMLQPEFTPDEALGIVKRLRNEATANFKDPTNYGKMELAGFQRGLADAMEGLIEQRLDEMGSKELVRDFRYARMQLAKIHDAEDAMNIATGDISASKLAQLLDRGRPLSGGMKTAAQFSKQFPRASGDVSRIGSQAYITPFDFFFGVGSIAAGHAVAPAVEMAARHAIPKMTLSDWWQRRLVAPPTYRPGMATRALASPMFGDALRATYTDLGAGRSRREEDRRKAKGAP